MDKFFKTAENFETALRLIEVINRTTDDFLFVLDIANDTNRFFGPIDDEFDVRQPGKDTNTTAEMLNVVYPADRKALTEDLERIAKGEQQIHDMSYRWFNKRGEIVWVNCRGQVINDENGNPYIMIGRVSEEALRHLYNPLTGLWNKTKLREDLAARLNTGRGYLILFDINGLAAINLSHGRSFGDELLREVANLIDGAPNVIEAYHIDHNNFAAIVDAKEPSELEAIYTLVCETMKDKCSFASGAVPIDKEIFIDVGQLIDSANMTLKKAKQSASDRLEFFSSEEIEERINSLMLLEELKESVQNGFEGFEVYYQPQVKGGSYEIYGVEALLRYVSKTRGRVFPNDFIPLLEQSRLIEQVGLWVLEEALLQCKKWREGIPGLRVSVNFSSVQFEDRYIGEKIVDVLKKTEMPGNSLMVELTESIQLQASEHFSNRIKYLKAYGIGLSIDDFGTGYSNLGYLKQLDANEIKIDRSFVSGIRNGTYNYKLISNVIEFAKTNAIHVCCEGVETTEELAILEGLRPNIIQGYLFDKPCPAAEIEESYINASSEQFKERVRAINNIYRFKAEIGVIHFDAQDILRENDIGLWVIRIDKAKGHFEMHTDDTMDRILGMERKYAPAECYAYWHEKIAEGYADYVHENVDIMISTGRMVQLKYPWNHPTLGTVTVRCSGRRVEDADGMVVLEGYHRILSDVEGI
ncbi:MAG: EAL domain-containing protein [Clostridia bacterium]|nr:EAL domain-containing protein [Clostridia bacterium]